VSSTDFAESLLILSDVHLGNDLNDLTRGGARRSECVDADLASLGITRARAASLRAIAQAVCAGSLHFDPDQALEAIEDARAFQDSQVRTLR